MMKTLVFIVVTCVVILHHAEGADRNVRATIAGTGWTPYEYFSEDFKDKGMTWVPRADKGKPSQNGDGIVFKTSEVDNRVESSEGTIQDSVPSSPKLINRRGYQQHLLHPTPSHSASKEFVVLVPQSPKVQTVYYPTKVVTIRSPICSQNRWEHTPLYAFSKSHGRCYRIGSKGPCNPNMKFLLESENSEYGRCDCDPNVGYTCGRPLVYWAENDWCYPVYSQGPCRRNEWIVLSRSGHPVCEPNKCSWEQRFDGARETDCRHWVHMRGQCWETSTKGFCGYGEVLFWNVYDSTATRPTCIPERSSINPKRFWNQALDISQFDESLPCLPGQRQTIRRKCRPN